MSLVDALVGFVDESTLSGEAQGLVWAAFAGYEALEEALGADPGAAPPEPPSAPATRAKAAGVWLSAISVEGFRGIGPRAELVLKPGPGLTLVVGRNGSGKSSFAEGLEALVTGANLRWSGKTKVWQEGWRNLHHDGVAEVGAEFQREGDTTSSTLTRRWGGGFDESEVSCELSGSPVEFSWLGWDEALLSYKPFLSYNELGSMLDQKPSQLYDSMAGVLGLDRLTESRELLRRARLDAEAPAKALKKRTGELIAALVDVDDERASTAAALLAERTTDVDALSSLVDGGGDEADGMRALATIQSPDRQACRERRQALADAIEARAAVTGSDATRSANLAELLGHALAFHQVEAARADGEAGAQADGESGGEVDCPVCGDGRLDAEWRARATDEMERLRLDATVLTEADAAIDRALREATSLLREPPAALTEAGPGQAAPSGPADPFEPVDPAGTEVAADIAAEVAAAAALGPHGASRRRTVGPSTPFSNASPTPVR